MGQGLEGPHIRRVAPDVHGHNGRRSRGDTPGRILGVQVKGVGVNIGKDRRSASVHHRRRAGHEGVGRHDDLVPPFDAQGCQGGVERHCPVGHGQAILGVVVTGKILFEPLDGLRSHTPLIVFNHLFESLKQSWQPWGPGGPPGSVDGWIAT